MNTYSVQKYLILGLALLGGFLTPASADVYYLPDAIENYAPPANRARFPMPEYSRNRFRHAPVAPGRARAHHPRIGNDQGLRLQRPVPRSRDRRPTFPRHGRRR